MLDRALLHLKFLKNCDMFLLWVRLRGADDWQTKTNKFAVKFSRIFRWRRALSSKVFHWFHVAKCYSELKNEELSWKKLPPKLFGKLSYQSTDIVICNRPIGYWYWDFCDLPIRLIGMMGKLLLVVPWWPVMNQLVLGYIWRLSNYLGDTDFFF